MTNQQKTYELVVQPREVLGKASKRLRREHILPGTLYGYGVEATPVQADQKEFERVYLRAGNNGLVDLKIGDGNGKMSKVFIHAVQRNPITHAPMHVDFMVINLKEEITTMVPLALVGEAPAIKLGEGVLLHQLDHVQIRALPADIPPLIQVDISGLDEVDKAIYVSDLTIPGNVHLLTHEEEMVVKITALRVAEVEEVEEAEEAEAAEEGAPEGGEEAEGAGAAEETEE